MKIVNTTAYYTTIHHYVYIVKAMIGILHACFLSCNTG